VTFSVMMIFPNLVLLSGVWILASFGVTAAALLRAMRRLRRSGTATAGRPGEAEASVFLVTMSS
jgi:hypothetical protein